MTFRRATLTAIAGVLLLGAGGVFGQAPPGRPAPITVLSREGRRSLPVVEISGRPMIGLDDLAGLFQLTVREDTAARALTVSYRGQTIVLTPDQAIASVQGRLVSLPAAPVHQGQRWLVPPEFVSRALGPIYDARLDWRPSSRLLIVGDLRVPRVTVRFEDAAPALRVVLEIEPKTTAAVSQEQTRLLVRIDADLLDATLPPPPPQNGLLSSIHAVEPNTIQLDLGPRFASYRAAPPISTGANAELAIELMPATAESSAAPPPAVPAAPASDLPVFGGAPGSSIRTVVIDPGHGGDQAGVKGPGGGLEKDIVLAVARRLKAAVEGRLGVRAILTREGDANPDADTRAAIANNNKADLLISLHANGSPRAAVRGAEIYFLDLDRYGEEARRHSEADREVLQVYGGGAREFALVDWELAQAAHVADSTAFAGFVEQHLRGAPRLQRVAVMKGPMRPLAGANMPAVLIEMGYLSNPDEEKALASPEVQQGIAQALTESVIAFRGYLEGPR